jgi:hypothetical protein
MSFLILAGGMRVTLCALGLWLRVYRIALIVAEYSEQSDSNP